jgi:AcrR family transcriptional regulator
LLAERPFTQVSLRDITAAAQVNIAAVNYHFGSRDQLLFALFRRGAEALNRERIRLLREAGEEANGTPSLEAIIRALVEPGIRFTLHGYRLSLYNQIVVLARSGASPEMRSLLERDVRHLKRFVTALSKALPHLSRTEIYWRLHFVMGVQHSIYSDLARLDALSDGECNAADIPAIVARVIAFAVAGLNGK